MVTYKQGNLLNSGCNIICHQVNCQGVMGSGIALEIRNRFPEAYATFRKTFLNGGNKLGAIDIVYETQDNMMIAAIDVLNRRGVNYTRNCFVDCGDIDIRCVHMAYLQLSLTGTPAIIKHQDALSRQLWDAWRTPAYLLQYPRFCKFETLT